MRHAESGADWTPPYVQSARPGALTAARTLLAQSADPFVAQLAMAGDAELLERLGVVGPDGRLTPTGLLAFVGRGLSCVEYVRRPHAGADSVIRLRWSQTSLLEELVAVLDTLESIEAEQSVVAPTHPSQRSSRRAAYEAIVNGIAHRDWSVYEPTLIEHIGHSIRVTSPGGFVHGVTEHNVMTHPSRTPNPELMDLFVTLGLANREGLGIDRIVGDVVRRGHDRPEIVELPGPAIQVTLTCDHPDEAWLAWLNKIDQPGEVEDLNSVVLLRHLVDVGWIDAAHAAHEIQDSRINARRALAQLRDTTMDGMPLLVEIPGIPDVADPVWVLSEAAREFMARMDHGFGQRARVIRREGTARDYLMGRGRISAIELAAVVHATPEDVQPVLKRLEREGVMVPMCPDRWGRAGHYVPAPVRSVAW